ncbi:MAG: hypothetical protein QG670_1695 [Thermoproteota archaeon]|nr:hypothetical protein [Thermoproteota archaeon]
MEQLTPIPAGISTVWLMVVRNSDSFLAYYSLDGSTWTQHYSWSQHFIGSLMVGLEVADAHNNVSFQSTFSYFHYSSLVTSSYSMQEGNSTYLCTVTSNSLVSNFTLNQSTKEIGFNVTGDTGTVGISNVSFPTQLLGSSFTIFIDGTTLPATVTSNTTHSSVCFTYTQNTHQIEIIGSVPSKYSISLKTVDWSENILPSCTVTISNVSTIISNAYGWSNFTGINSGTYLVTISWQGSTINQTSITVNNSNVTSTIRTQVYNISLANSFRDTSGNRLYTNPSSFKLIFSNGTTSAILNSSQNYCIQNGTTTWYSILWQDTNIVPSTLTSFDTTNGNPTINCEVYSLQVNPTFQDNLGLTTITTDLCSLTFPNGTVRTSSTSLVHNQVQYGNYTITSILLKGREVVPKANPTITLTGNTTWAPQVRCLLPTYLTLHLNSQTSLPGFQVNINGTLKFNNKGIGGAKILLSYSDAGNQTWNDITEIWTSPDGSYSTVWTLSPTDTFLVWAHWAGNNTFPSTNASRALSMTTFNDQYVFSVSSNSTISALAFNKTSNELSFTVKPTRNKGLR